jgi:hypothetical protein
MSSLRSGPIATPKLHQALLQVPILLMRLLVPPRAQREIQPSQTLNYLQRVKPFLRLLRHRFSYPLLKHNISSRLWSQPTRAPTNVPFRKGTDYLGHDAVPPADVTYSLRSLLTLLLFVAVAELLPICLEPVVGCLSCRRWLVLELSPLVGLGAVAVLVPELFPSVFLKLLSVGLVAVACRSCSSLVGLGAVIGWSWSCRPGCFVAVVVGRCWSWS